MTQHFTESEQRDGNDTPDGAQASAVIFTVFETAKMNGLNPEKYIGHEEMDEDSEVLLQHAFTHGIYGSSKSYKAGRIAAIGARIGMNTLFCCRKPV